MSYLTSSTPAIELFVRDQFLYNQKEKAGSFTPGWLVGVRTVRGQATTFHILLNNGVLFTGLPIHALCSQEKAPELNLGDLQMWDNISYDHSVVEFDFIKSMNCKVLLRNKEIHDGRYIFSIDFSSQNSLRNLAETPHEWKIFHFIALANGCFALYPQNRIMFSDASLLKPTDPSSIRYQVNTQIWNAEDGNKWSVGNDDSYFYGVDKQ